MRGFKKLLIFTLILSLLGSQYVFADSVDLGDTPMLGTATETSTAVSGSITDNTSAGGASAELNAAALNTAAQNTAAQVNVDSGIAKPELASEAGVLYDATTKQFLFTKNADKAMYPASITKVMTVLLAAERLSPTEVIKFSSSATDNLESGYTNVSIVAGDTMTVQDAMYAVLLKSACEVSNGLAEKVAGTQKDFAELMNLRAEELGCTGTNFRNASGLNDASHYTTAHDMALITAAAFSNAAFRAVASAKNHTLPASKKRGSLKLTNSNKMLYSANGEYMEGIVGGKTGYTSKAGNTLVEVLDTNGHELVAVVMKSNGKQYSDAKALFNYGKKLIDSSGTAKEKGTWEAAANGRKYRHADGKQAVNEWVEIGGNEYFFGSDGIAATGWKQFTDGAWYYFDTETGAMVHDKWVSTDGEHYYYLQSDGVLAVNTVINGMYRVNENGIYVEKVG